MYKVNTVIFGALIAAGIIGISALVAQSSPTANAQDQSASEAVAAMGGAFASVTTEITDTQIVITIDRNPDAPPMTPVENVTLPEGPIIIVPPNNETGEEGTIIVPPVENETGEVPPGNVTIIEPEGNVTQIEPPTNVTVIDNDTVVIAPPDQPVTETPGNVTVIDPPAVNVTEPAPGEPAACTCPPVGVEGAAPDIQAPGSNITVQNDTTIIRPDTEPGSDNQEENQQQEAESNDNGG